MRLSDKIILIGMPGSGKSTLGKELALRLNMPFVDLDAYIERRAGKAIKEIFEENGEDYFRNLESTALRTVLNAKDPFVLSTGGGAPCFKGNMELIANNGVVIFLDPPIDILAARLLNTDLAERPKLSGRNDLMATLKTTYDQRTSFYRQAAYVISERDPSVDAVIEVLTSK